MGLGPDLVPHCSRRSSVSSRQKESEMKGGIMAKNKEVPYVFYALYITVNDFLRRKSTIGKVRSCCREVDAWIDRQGTVLWVDDRK